MSPRTHIGLLVLLAASLAAVLTACTGPSPGAGGTGQLGQSPAAPQDTTVTGLTALDVETVIEAAARAVSNNVSIAVVDRVGNILGVFNRGSTPDNDEAAVGLARTGAFFSHNQGPLSSELIRFLSRENFPEAVQDTPSADLFGIEHTNRGCPVTDTGAGQFPFNAGGGIPPARNIANTGTGIGVTTVPGGFPLYKGNLMVGGVGVFGAGDQVDEYASLVSTTNFQLAAPPPGKIFLVGIELPYVHFDSNRTTPPTIPPGTVPGTFPGGGTFRALPDFTSTSGLAYATAGTAVTGTRPSPIVKAPFAPEGYLIGPRAGTKLSKTDVDTIIQLANAQANLTRAAIRLPIGTRCKMFFCVTEGIGGTSLEGVPVAKGTILGYFRMPDATIFSGDVCSEKAKNAVYFNEPDRDPADLPGVPPGVSVTARTIGFGSQSMFPSGIKNSDPGPFRSLFLFDADHPCTQGQDFAPPTGFGPQNVFPAQNKQGVCFFPGSSGLYRNGQLIGGWGASGDGVNQDDVITNAGAVDFLPAPEIRADQLIIRGVRLPFFKFSRNPDQ